MANTLGSPIGLLRQATIVANNDNGTVLIKFDEAGTPKQKIVPVPSAWTGPGGQFIGGSPIEGSTVLIAEVAVAGNWHIVATIPSTNVFRSGNGVISTSSYGNPMSALQEGRALMQVKNGTRLFLDPAIGIQAGDSTSYLHIDPYKDIISSNFSQKLEFTESHRKINGIIKRDLRDNSARELLYSTLDSQDYDSALTEIGLDPTISTSFYSRFLNIRNPALIEDRDLVYEFANSSQFNSLKEELDKYSNSKSDTVTPTYNRTVNRTDTVSLNQYRPNHLIESIKGTVVDTFGNILDINKVPLPIGKLEKLSLKNNTDKADAFKRIISQLRKSVSFHFEINTKKGTEDIDNIVDTDSDLLEIKDYSRNQSSFSFDVDKEGQFKINIPASSNVGNIPLHTRSANFASIIAKNDSSISPNEFLRSETSQDIFIKNFASNTYIKLNSSDDLLDGYAAPHDFTDDSIIKYGTVYHDITDTCSSFLKSADYLSAGLKLVDFDPNNHLNTDFKPLDKIISDTIIVSGPKANGGGRSGSISADGFISLNIGANTIDRQSLWLDTAGSIVSNIGRDKNGISYAASLDGDMFIQIGGPGLGNSLDSRFSSENDAYRNGTLDIRVFVNGQIMILRLGPTGIDIVSPGTITLSCQQDMIFRTNSSMKFEAESIVMYAETTKRIVNRQPAERTIG